MPTCINCGTEFAWERQPGQRGRNKVYCTVRCGERARAARRPPKPRAPRTIPPTKTPADALAWGGMLRWEGVSAEERSSLMRAAALSRFTPEQIERAEARRRDLDARRQMPCPYCGDPVGRAGRVKCPKDECNLKHNAISQRGTVARRRAAKRGVRAERFDPREIFERDAWTCGICGDPVDAGLAWPDPGSVSLDHIVPLAMGGEHTRANTQCAHLYCNGCKGPRLTAD